MIPVTAGQTSTSINLPNICTTYQVVAKAATCAADAFSDPATISLVDVTIFDFIADLKGVSTCNNFIKNNNSESAKISTSFLDNTPYTFWLFLSTFAIQTPTK